MTFNFSRTCTVRFTVWQLIVVSSFSVISSDIRGQSNSSNTCSPQTAVNVSFRPLPSLRLSVCMSFLSRTADVRQLSANTRSRLRPFTYIVQSNISCICWTLIYSLPLNNPDWSRGLLDTGETACRHDSINMQTVFSLSMAIHHRTASLNSNNSTNSRQWLWNFAVRIAGAWRGPLSRTSVLFPPWLDPWIRDLEHQRDDITDGFDQCIVSHSIRGTASDRVWWSYESWELCQPSQSLRPESGSRPPSPN